MLRAAARGAARANLAAAARPRGAPPPSSARRFAALPFDEPFDDAVKRAQLEPSMRRLARTKALVALGVGVLLAGIYEASSTAHGGMQHEQRGRAMPAAEDVRRSAA